MKGGASDDYKQLLRGEIKPEEYVDRVVEQVKARMGKGVGMYVELFKGEGRQPYRYRLMGANGATLSVSEGYLTKWNTERAVRKAFPGMRVERDASWGT